MKRATDKAREEFLKTMDEDVVKSMVEFCGGDRRSAAGELGYETENTRRLSAEFLAGANMHIVGGVYFSSTERAETCRKILSEAGILHQYIGTRESLKTLRAAGFEI